MNDFVLCADNFDDFAEHFDEVIAVDWLGMGCSDRTSQRVSRLNRLDEFVPCTQPKEVREREIAQRVIDEFVDNLEELRKLENLEDFTLAGHSLGGYLAGQYTVKYPKHVNSLVLISPVGVPHAPAKDERMPEQQIDWRLRVIKELWQWNITPQLVVRLAGKRGQNMVLNAIDRRFQSRWSGETAQIMGDYAYNITATPGNGEYCLSALLEPVFTAPTPNSTGRESRVGRSGVYAKLPLEEALCKVPQPILLVYGDNDWLYYPEAAESVRKWQKAEVKTETGETEVRDRAADLLMVPQSGHHLYLENPSFFNSRMLAWLDEVPTKKSS